MPTPDTPNTSVQFETPENVQVQYELAGLGSRFVAWVEDQMLLFLIMIIVFVIGLFLGAGSHWFSDAIGAAEDENDAYLYVIGLVTMVLGFSNFAYFTVSELLLRGQTIGKRHAAIRVVKSNGYALDGGSIFLRNIFRVLDHIPLLWIVPVVTRRSQRLGDIVAGTVCITDETKKIGSLREVLLERPMTQREFRFDAAALKRARPSDILAVERILEAVPTLPPSQIELLLDKICDPLARRVEVDPPPANQRQRFLEDFLSSEYHRQHRHLG